MEPALEQRHRWCLLACRPIGDPLVQPEVLGHHDKIAKNSLPVTA
jgi:hypothetical protein